MRNHESYEIEDETKRLINLGEFKQALEFFEYKKSNFEDDELPYRVREIGKIFSKKDTLSAITFYENNLLKKYGSSWFSIIVDRLVTLNEKQKNYEEAIILCFKMYNDPEITHEEIKINYFLRLKQLYKKVNLDFNFENILPEYKTINIKKTGNERVEQIALEYYQSEIGGNWSGVWDNSLEFGFRVCNELFWGNSFWEYTKHFFCGEEDFGISFWPEIPDYLKGKEISYYFKFKTNKLAETIKKRIIEEFNDYLKYVNEFLHENNVPLEEQQTTINRITWNYDILIKFIPAFCLSLDSIQLYNFLKEANNERRGIPDLFLFKCLNNKYEYKLVEVKSKNDKLSNIQLVWIKFLNKNNINFELCKVS